MNMNLFKVTERNGRTTTEIIAFWNLVGFPWARKPTRLIDAVSDKNFWLSDDIRGNRKKPVA